MVGVWSEALGDLMRGARSLSRTSFPVPAINILCSCSSASNNVHGCTQAICAYHRIDDLPEIRIVAARWRPIILMHSDDRPIGKDSIIRFIVLDT